MNADDLTTNTIILAIAWPTLAVLIGLVVRRLLVRQVSKSSAAGTGRSRRSLLDGLSKAALTWSILAGLYGAALTLPLQPGLEGFVVKVLLAGAILAGSLGGARAAGGFVGQYAAKNQRLPGATSIFANIAKLTVIMLGILVTLQTLGVSVTPILTALGVGGLAVALALQDTLSNLFAGLHIIASKKVLPGDYVLLDSGEEGYVEDVNWRNTSLRHLRNNVIVVPNSHLASAVLTNYYQPASEMFMLVPVGVSYESDLDHVERVTIDVANEVMREVDGGIPDSKPFVRFHTFNDFSIDFSVILKIREHTDQYAIKHEFVKRLHNRFRREGIEIPFPIRTLRFPQRDMSPQDLVRDPYEYSGDRG